MQLGPVLPAGTYLNAGPYAPYFVHDPVPQPVARTGFFTSSAIDERCAAYGKYFEDVSFRQYVPDKTACCRLDGAAVIGSDGLIWDNGLLLRDSVRHLSYSIADSVCARIHEDDSVTLKRPLMLGSATAGSFFCGFTGSWRGYSHWLIESMPRLYIYTQLRKEIPSLKILLPEFPKGGFQEQALQLFSIASHDVITVANHAIFRAQHLYVAGAIDIWSVPRIVLAAAQCLLSVVRGAVSHLEFPEDRRIYIHRAPPARRAVRNLNQLQPILDEYGFQTVDFASFSLRHQILLAAQSRLVIGDHGAGLTNIMFCCPGTRILELFNPACVQPAFWSLASCCGHDFGFVVGSHFPTDRYPAPNWFADYAVSPDDFRCGLARLVSG